MEGNGLREAGNGVGLEHQELTGKIIGVCFEVHNELGAGFLESVYQSALLLALKQAGLEAYGQVPLQVTFRGQVVGEFIADIVVDGIVLVELKAAQAIAREHHAQVINYLKATGIPIGLLINFGTPKMEFRRFHK